MLMNLCQNVCHRENKTHLKVGNVGSKTRSFGLNLIKCVYSRKHSFDPICMKLCKNVCYHKISDKFETESCRSKSRSLDDILENCFFSSPGESPEKLMHYPRRRLLRQRRRWR